MVIQQDKISLKEQSFEKDKKHNNIKILMENGQVDSEALTITCSQQALWLVPLFLLVYIFS